DCVLDHRLDRREAGATCDQNDRFVRLLAQVERTERAFEAKNLATLELLEQLIGEEPSRNVPDVKLDQATVLGRRRHRKATAPPTLEQHVDKLTGQILQALVRR